MKIKQAKINNDEATWKLFKAARNEANNAIQTAKRKYFKTNLDSSKKDPKKTWKLINDLTSRKCKTNNILEINHAGKSANTPEEISEVFNSHFTRIGENLARDIPDTDIDPISYVDTTSQVFSFSKIGTEHVTSLLRTMDTNKAAGLDNIPCNLLKIAAEIVSPSLTYIFNLSLETGIFPQDWKIAKVSPIFKKGDKTDIDNYRPISVISIIAKIFEKIIHNQFNNYLSKNKLLNKYQSGFRSLHSTMTALLETTNNWSVNIDKGLLNGVIFIDLKKAFDTIDHNIILKKLACYGADHSVLKWFTSYLTNRGQKCYVNGHLSNIQSISYGVPQGSIIGPLLFLLYINDLPNCLSEGSPRMFADDTNISQHAETTQNLEAVMNTELQNLEIWLKANKLSLNITKTEFMIIGSRQKLQTQEDCTMSISIQGNPINRVNSTKSLGLYIDDNLTWKHHINNISKTISAGINALKRVRRFIGTETAIKLYKALIEPHFNYCSSVWDGLNVKLSEKLQKLQNRAARVITRSSYDIPTDNVFERLKWNKLSSIRNKHKAILMHKIMNDQTPDYLKELFEIRPNPYNLRDSENKLSLPKPRTDYLKRSISYSGAHLWNNLPKELRLTKSLNQFKKGIQNKLT